MVVRRSPLRRPTKPIIELPIAPYSFLKSAMTLPYSSPCRMRASPSTQVPVGFPPLSEGTIPTCGLFLIRLTFHVLGSVRKYTLPFSSIDWTGVSFGVPSFLYDSRLMYLRPENCVANRDGTNDSSRMI